MLRLDAVLAGHASAADEFRAHARGRLLAQRAGLVRRLERLGGSAGLVVGAPARSLGGLRRENRVLRAEIRALDVPIPPALRRIAECESSGDPRAIGGGGAYRGLFRFDRGTWAGVGGSGDPAAAPVAEQYRRAALLYARSGAAPWPVCGA